MMFFMLPSGVTGNPKQAGRGTTINALSKLKLLDLIKIIFHILNNPLFIKLSIIIKKCSA